MTGQPGADTEAIRALVREVLADLLPAAAGFRGTQVQRIPGPGSRSRWARTGGGRARAGGAAAHGS